MKPLLYLACAVLSWSATWVHAEEPTELPEILVSDQTEDSRTPATTQTSIVDLQSGIAVDGADLIRAIPGVDAARMGGHGLDPIIRGQSQNRLNVLIDGAQPFGGCPNRMDPPTVFLDLDSYDSVTVIKGSQTVRHGAGGSGGTLLFERQEARFNSGEGPRMRVNGALAGPTGTRDLSTALSLGNPLGFLRITGYDKSADDYRDGNGDRVRSAYDSHGAGLLLGLTPSDTTRLELSHDWTHDSDVYFAGAGMDSLYSDAKQWRARLLQDAPLGPFEALRAEVYAVNVDHLMDNYSLRALSSPFKQRVPTTSNSQGARLLADLWAFGGTLTLGSDYLDVQREATRYWNYRSSAVDQANSYLWPDVANRDLGLFAELVRPLGARGELTTGLRYDRVEADISQSRARQVPVGPSWVKSAEQLYAQYYGAEAGDQHEDNWGGLLRYQHRLDDGLRLSAGLSRTVRTADASERYIASNGATGDLRWIGNPELDPEAHHQLDLGLSRQTADWTLSLDLFYDQVADFILRDRARGQFGILPADQATVYRNVAARLAGGELAGSVTLGHDWLLSASLAYVQAQNRDDDHPIAQIPPLSGAFEARYDRERFELGARLLWSANQDRVDADPFTGSGLDPGETPGWWTLDLYAEVELLPQARLHLGVDNVFDRAYAHHVNRANVDPFDPDPVQINEPGRTLWAELRLDL